MREVSVMSCLRLRVEKIVNYETDVSIYKSLSYVSVVKKKMKIQIYLTQYDVTQKVLIGTTM